MEYVCIKTNVPLEECASVDPVWNVKNKIYGVDTKSVDSLTSQFSKLNAQQNRSTNSLTTEVQKPELTFLLEIHLAEPPPP